MAEITKEDAKLHPLVIFYDSEAAYGNVYRGDIIEIAAKCHPDVVKGSFESLINTKQPLCAFATRECAISEEHLRNKPFFREVLNKFVFWINDMVKLAQKKHGKPFVPVLCAHHGYQFDFLILLNNMERSGIRHTILSQHNIHFADSLLFCSELKDKGEKLLAHTKLSLDGLFKKFFPRKIIKDRHRAMGDVEAMVDIFTHTPLKKLLHNMKYSSTKERLEYYISQSGLRQQQAILEENLYKLDACSKNMAIKKLLKEGITYNSLRTIYEECCSFMDFYEAMKSYGIERKVAKVITLHFSGKGFENQGARPYSKLHEEKPATSNSTQESTEDEANGDHPVQHGCSKDKQEPKILAENKHPEPKTCNQVEGSEDWESEVAMAVPRKNFTLKCTTPTPLSLDVDDFSSAQSGKARGKLSPQEKHQNPSSKVSHSRSETNESRNGEVSGKKLHGKAAEAEVRERTYHPKSKVLTESSEKRGGRLNKPVKDRKWDGRAKREAKVSTKGNKKEFIKEKTPKSTDTVTPKKHSEGDKETESCVENTSSNEQETLNKIKLQFQCSPCDKSCSSSEDVLGKIEKELQPTVIPSMDDGLSTKEVVQKFTSVFIGDIAILIPVENSGEDCNSDGNEVHETGLDTKDKTEKNTVAECTRREDASLVIESPADSMNPGQMETTSQSESNASCPQSPHGALNTRVHEETEKEVITKCKKVVDSDEGNSSKCEKLMENQGLTSGNEDSLSPMESRIQIVTTDENNSLTDGNNDINIVKGTDAVVAMDKTSHQEETSDLEVTGVNVQNPVLPAETESNHNGPFIEGSNGVSIPWQELQQMPHAPLPEHVLHVHVDQAASERFVMSEGLACHDVNTDDVDHTRHDLQAELSSESSSTSGESSIDAFSRQPPLGAERVFTPDTVHQQPDQTAWVGSVNEGMYMYPMPSGPSVNYPQGSFASYGNPYGTFHQAQQALPLLKPYFSSFGYPNQIRSIVAPQIMQPHPQVYMPPYFQYRNQMMLPNAVPPVAGFPSAAMPPLQFQPKMYQVWQGHTGYTYPPVPFYGNPYEQAQETTGAMLDVQTIQSKPNLSQVSSSIEYPSPAMDLTCSLVGDMREEFGCELSSTASSDSPFELRSASTNSSFPVCDHSTLLPTQLEHDPGFSMLVTNEANQNGTEQELKGKGVLSGGVSESKNADKVFSLVQLCHKDVSENDKEHLNKSTDTCYLNSSKGYFSHPVSRDQGDPVHKQITILSREESAVARGRRLSPDGSCMDAVCLDSPDDTSSVQKIERPLEERSSSTSTYTCTWKIPSQEYNKCRPSNASVKERCPSPKPQRIKGSRSSRNKHTQPSLANGVSNDIIPVASPDVLQESVSSRNSHNCNKRDDEASVMSGKKTKADHSQRTVRFSNEHIECDSTNSNLHGQEKVASTDKNYRSTSSHDHNMNNAETSQTKSCSIDSSLTKSSRVEGHDARRLHEGRSYKHAEKRTPGMDSKPAHVRGNPSKRVHNRMRRPYIETRSQKQPSRAKQLETDAKIDTNNNSG